MKVEKLDDFARTEVLYVFYDFEATQETDIQGTANTKIHVPNLCAVGTVCTHCIGKYSEINECVECDAEKRQIFKTNVVGDFVD